MDFVDDIIGTEFGLLFVITLLVFGGFLLYLTYIYKKMRYLITELESIKNLDE